jgi:hypothetical protein
MAEGFKALKLEDDGVPVETVSGNGLSHLQVQFLRFEIHLTFSCCFLVLDLVFGGGGTAVDWHKVMVVGYWQY